MNIEYFSLADMNQAILSSLHKFPKDIDLVVGVPRSGMLPANLIALYLNKPYTDIDSFLEGRVFSTGERGGFIVSDHSNKILVVDDSIHSGNSLIKVKQKLAKIIAEDKYELLFAAVFSTEQSADKVDIYCQITGIDRIFQWNLFHHKRFTTQAFFDIDGVLCPNPPVDDDGEEYVRYISTAPVLYRPSVEVDTLVTCRLEKYRSITEKWLRENRIQYRRLVMLDFSNKQERVAWGRHGEYKGKVYRDSDSCLFFESSLREAKDIFLVSQKPVFCTETFALYTKASDFEYVEKGLYEQVSLLVAKNEELIRYETEYTRQAEEKLLQAEAELQRLNDTLRRVARKNKKHLLWIRLLVLLILMVSLGLIVLGGYHHVW